MGYPVEIKGTRIPARTQAEHPGVWPAGYTLRTRFQGFRSTPVAVKSRQTVVEGVLPLLSKPR